MAHLIHPDGSPWFPSHHNLTSIFLGCQQPPSITPTHTNTNTTLIHKQGKEKVYVQPHHQSLIFTETTNKVRPCNKFSAPRPAQNSDRTDQTDQTAHTDTMPVTRSFM